ncbi:cellobiohydrolaseI [Mycena galericulata]|nr:cellobiohydrolaseI [Mycena galericulata]
MLPPQLSSPAILFAVALLHCTTISNAQNVGTEMPETHPTLTIQQCSTPGVCSTVQYSVVLDGNLRPINSIASPASCFFCDEWNPAVCPNPVTCVENCALEGVDYANAYGITTNGSSIRMNLVTGCNVGSRVFLLASPTLYKTFDLLNGELAFTVDMSHLGCGVNGALNLLAMDPDGGQARFPGNKAGAKYGTGYCDASCGQDVKFVNGMANTVDWTPSPVEPLSGTGNLGSCCPTLDIWAGNMNAASYAAHPCTVVGQTDCSGAQCATLCDADGCDFNPYRMGDPNFLGLGKQVDTTQPFTVVTQFITNTGASTGSLTEVRRFYVQNNKVIENSNTNLAGIVPAANSITDAFCVAQKAATGDVDRFEALGGLLSMSSAMVKGMVLALSIQDDYVDGMAWLDGVYPPTASPSAPGVSRGPCSASSGVPDIVEDEGDYVVFSNILVGPIGSTLGSLQS